MKKVSLALVAILTIFTACKENPKSQFNRKVADYAVVTLETPSLEGISDNGKEVLNLYRFAAQEIDALYWEQYFGNRDSLLSAIKDPVQQLFAQINYGPWDRTDGKSFVEGYADRLPGAGFYPSDMTVQEFENFEDPAKASPYTLITRGEDGSLKAVWYHDAYKEHLEKIANYLRAAADITIKPSVKKYLLSKADALLSDNYYQSGIDWLDMTDSKMDLVIGPNETADDQLLGIKRSYEAFVLLKNESKTEELMQYVDRLEEFQQYIPCDAAYKNFQPGTGSNIFSCNALYYAGKANAGVKVIALNLPFDTDVQRDKGTRTILLENVIHAKFNSVVWPTGTLLLDSESSEKLSSDAFFWNIVFREVAHGLALLFEEMKGNVVGTLLVCKLQNHYDIHNLFTKEGALATFFASLVRSERFGEASALGRANTSVYNYLHEAGAFVRKDDGKYTLDYAKMESALADLSALILKTQALGDAAFAADFEAKYSKRQAEYEADLLNLGLEGIPMDIRFEIK